MSQKDENIKNAKSWLKAIDENAEWANMIKYSLESTTVQTNIRLDNANMSYIISKLSNKRPEVRVAKQTTYDMILEESNECLAVLNFASYFKPGGGYIEGSYAQEESLCAVSGLYRILQSVPRYQERHSEEKIPDEYKSELIYSPRVPFTRDEGRVTSPILVDVVSCAAPNCNRVPISKLNIVDKAINERLTACFLTPYLNGCNVLILGAWGCGVFKNSPIQIAQVFRKLIKKYGSLYDKVLFAIPNNATLDVFSSTLLN